MADTPEPTAENDLMKEYKGYGPVAKGILWTLVGATVLYMAGASCRHIGSGATPSQLERKVHDAKPAGIKPGDYTKSY